MKSSYVRNLSNVFSSISPDSVGKQLKRTLDKVSESVSGIEVTMKKGETNLVFVSPPSLRYGGSTHESRQKIILRDCTMYEGYLQRPFFLPLYGDLNGEFMENLELLSDKLRTDETIQIQWLFTQAYNWKDTAIEMYTSYLEGNDSPLPFKIGRTFQDKTLNVLNRLSSAVVGRSYSEEVEQKILSDGIRFQLRIAISSPRPARLREELEEIFKQYDSHNAIRLAEVEMRDKKLPQYIEECIVTPDNRYQIITMNELLSIFGTDEMEEHVPYTPTATSIPNVEEYAPTDATELLPDYPVTPVPIKEGLIQDIADALKRVHLIKQARLYNESVTAGIRLTVVQFDIPKDKTLTHITSKATDIQAALGVNSLSIEQGDEPDTVKLSIPNEKPAIIGLRTLLEQDSFLEYRKDHKLAFIVGVDEMNNPIYLSLAEVVHLLVAGTTGSGKSVFVNALAITLMLTHSPEELRMVMIDPKQVEMQQYVDFPHVDEVVTDMKKASAILSELAEEMDSRYTTFREVGVKSIELHNHKVRDPESGVDGPIMPYIVCLIDEYADLSSLHPIVEDYIVRLGQLARAAGIHLVIATQRPSVNVISGKIKANVLNAISFNLQTNINYKTVFGHGIGNTTLLGKGDGLMKITGYPKDLQRFQSAIIAPDEREEEQVYKNLAAHLNKGHKPDVAAAQEVPVEKQEQEVEVEVKEVKEVLQEDVREMSNLYKLKQLIATTGETKMSQLRPLMKIKATTLTELMVQLVKEGWLKKESNSKGYELIASEEMLEAWKN